MFGENYKSASILNKFPFLAPEVYHTVMQLAGFLLTHGGVTRLTLLLMLALIII
jgi:hypothetical protein